MKSKVFKLCESRSHLDRRRLLVARRNKLTFWIIFHWWHHSVATKKMEGSFCTPRFDTKAGWFLNEVKWELTSRAPDITPLPLSSSSLLLPHCSSERWSLNHDNDHAFRNVSRALWEACCRSNSWKCSRNAVWEKIALIFCRTKTATAADSCESVRLHEKIFWECEKNQFPASIRKRSVEVTLSFRMRSCLEKSITSWRKLVAHKKQKRQKLSTLLLANFRTALCWLV